MTVNVSRSQTSQKSIEKYLSIEKENYPLLKKIPVIDQLINNNRFNNVLCVGAGPSLDAQIEDVLKLVNSPNRPLIIAPSTALNALLKHAIEPDIVAMIDIHIKAESIPFDKVKNSVFVGSSRVEKAIWEQWKGKQYYFHLVDETFDRISEKLPSRYRLNIFGSVIHPMTHLAILFGAKTIRFVGCDFGFPRGVQHASTNDNYQIDMNVSVENGHGELIKSSHAYRMFCSGIENIISQRKDIDFINMSRIGAKIIGTRYEDETF
ncbi:6-hydroxymethylpterin diphosphokinase MptE-like protein [Vibrio sp. Hal054]|uniref:6-hydroxymethylpterin diphosphokinase MptE-like protein n=1 Tax=Vibrio sp. Hal054 TaxID=3035158 RepID=UPI00301E19E3